MDTRPGLPQRRDLIGGHRKIYLRRCATERGTIRIARPRSGASDGDLDDDARELAQFLRDLLPARTYRQLLIELVKT